MIEPNVRDLKSRAVSGVKWNAFSQVATKALALLTGIILARLLDPSDFGIYSIALLIIGFFQLFANGGMAKAIIREADIDHEVLSSLFWINYCIGICLFLVSWTIAPLAAHLYQEVALTQILRWISFGFLLNPPSNFLNWLLRREMRFKRITWIELISALSWLLATSGLAFHGYGVYALVWGYLIRSSISTFAYMFGSNQHFIFRFRSVTAAFARRDILRFAGFQLVERVTGFLGNNADFLIIGGLLGVEALGFYALAYNLMLSLVRSINPMIMSVVFPALSLVKENEEIIKTGYLRVMQLISSVVFPVFIGAAIVASPMIETAYGAKWMPSLRPFQMLSLFAIFYSLRDITLNLLQIRGRADLSLLYNLISMVAFFSADYIGAKVAGYEGVAVAVFAVSVFFLLPIDFWLRNRYVSVSTREFFSSIKPASIATAGMATITWIVLNSLSSVRAPFALVACVMAGGFVYFLALWISARRFMLEMWRLLGLRVPTPIFVGVSKDV